MTLCHQFIYLSARLNCIFIYMSSTIHIDVNHDDFLHIIHILDDMMTVHIYLMYVTCFFFCLFISIRKEITL